MDKFHVPPLGRGLSFLDWLFRPLMRLVAGPRAWREEPQRTHWWNNLHLGGLPPIVHPYLLRVPGDPHAVRMHIGPLPLSHLPIIGGWKRYVVLAPKYYRDAWHPGWHATNACGCSRVAIEGSVRLLVGPHDAAFFGISVHGEPITLEVVGYGRIGDGGPYCQLPLL